MAGRNRAQWRLAAALAVLSWLSVGCQSVPPATMAGSSLDQGPTRWLMLPDEQRQFRKLRTTREIVEFIERFWLRRDPDPGAPGNPFAKTFYERVEAADRLYQEGAHRGSLTDRGRALILLGPPPVLRYNQKKVPAWEPGRPGSPSAVQTRSLSVETWAYLLAELPPELRRRVEEDGGTGPEIELVFAAEPRRTYLVEGEKYLEMAVRAAVRE